jgi:hypothetical protein
MALAAIAAKAGGGEVRPHRQAALAPGDDVVKALRWCVAVRAAAVPGVVDRGPPGSTRHKLRPLDV